MMLGSANRRLILKLVAVVLGMFAFGFAMVPLYNIFCDITGLNGKVDLTPVSVPTGAVNVERRVTLEMVANLGQGINWQFGPKEASMTVHPGQAHNTSFIATNPWSDQRTAHAVPSVYPGSAARYLKKIECFCFNEQVFEGAESKEMPLQFVIDPALPDSIDTITLSYTLYESVPSESQTD